MKIWRCLLKLLNWTCHKYFFVRDWVCHYLSPLPLKVCVLSCPVCHPLILSRGCVTTCVTFFLDCITSPIEMTDLYWDDILRSSPSWLSQRHAHFFSTTLPHIPALRYCVGEAYTTKSTNKCWICISFLEGKNTLCAGQKIRHLLHCSEGMAIGWTKDAGNNKTLVFSSQTFALEGCSLLEWLFRNILYC